ncbi:hypothetical protein [Microcoleus sp. B4-D4]
MWEIFGGVVKQLLEVRDRACQLFYNILMMSPKISIAKLGIKIKW